MGEKILEAPRAGSEGENLLEAPRLSKKKKKDHRKIDLTFVEQFAGCRKDIAG